MSRPTRDPNAGTSTTRGLPSSDSIQLTGHQPFYVTTPFEKELTIKMDAVASSVNLRYQETLLTALHEVARRLSIHFDSFYSPHYCAVILYQQRLKLQLFGSFLKHPGVAYNIGNNKVFVSMSYWRTLHYRENNMFAQFRQSGEPLYVQLRNIFVYSHCARLRKPLRYLFAPSSYEAPPTQTEAGDTPLSTF